MNASDYIFALAQTFPCLRHKIPPLMDDVWRDPVSPNGRHCFNSDALHRMSQPWSHGEKLCAMFILSVWNPNYALSRKWHFDFIEFMQVVDRGNKQALMNWMKDPRFP